MTNTLSKQVQCVLTDFWNELRSICEFDINFLRDVDITSDMISVDAIVEHQGMIVAVIEVVRNDANLTYKRRDIAKILKRAQVQIGVVITLDGDYYLRKTTQKESKKVGVEAIAKEIKKVYSSIKDELNPLEVKEKLMEMYDATVSFSKKQELRPLFEDACNHLKIKSGRVCMREQDEIRFMLSLLGNPDEDYEHICRYTSLNSLFYIMDSGKHAMCSPVSMNDKHECDYADRFMPWNVDRLRGEVEIENDNSYFLLSCSSIEESDVLTMWRLYGESAKGVCIEYEVQKDRIDNKHFFLARVSYGMKDRNTGKLSHPELEFMAGLQAEAIDSGWYFSFTKWYIWKFFFKAWEYKEENEIRLIHVPDIEDNAQYDRIKWYKDQSNGIFNRMSLIPVKRGERNDFPLLISKIILGPQSPEATRNREQIWYMADQKSIDTSADFRVEPSSINNYR